MSEAPENATGSVAASTEPRYLEFRGIAAERDTSVGDAVAGIRELRDEWDDRWVTTPVRFDADAIIELASKS